MERILILSAIAIGVASGDVLSSTLQFRERIQSKSQALTGSMEDLSVAKGNKAAGDSTVSPTASNVQTASPSPASQPPSSAATAVPTSSTAPPTPEGNYSTMYNYINETHNNIPILADDCTVKVYLGQRMIVSMGKLAKLFNLNHGGITFGVTCPRGLAGTPPFISFQYWAPAFPGGAIFPSTVNATSASSLPVWDDGSVITWERCRQSCDKSLADGACECPNTPWEYEVYMGSATAAQFNLFRAWVPAYLQEHQHYELWDVWSSFKLTPATKRFVNSSTCISFVEQAVVKLHALGASFNDPQPRKYLYRAYAPLATKHEPQTADVGDPNTVRELNLFYSRLTSIYQTVLSGNYSGDLRGFLLNLWHAFGSSTFFVKNQDTYVKVLLDEDLFKELVHASFNINQDFTFDWLNT